MNHHSVAASSVSIHRYTYNGKRKDRSRQTKEVLMTVYGDAWCLWKAETLSSLPGIQMCTPAGLIHAFVSLPESKSQTGSRSGHSFLRSSRKSSLCFTVGRPSPQNCPFSWGSGPYSIHDWAHPSPQTTRYLDRFSSFCAAH